MGAYVEDVLNESYPISYSSDDATQKQLYLESLHGFYHNSTEGIEWRNEYSMDVRHDAASDTFELRSFSFKTHSIYDFRSLQSQADKDEANWREWMAFSAADCRDTLSADEYNAGLCKPRYGSLRLSWAEGYKGYVSSAVGSVLFSLPMIFIILMLVLNNRIVGLFCVLNAILIMTSVLGIIGFIGWRFGLTESASVILVIGFSVDYCVHIAHGYLVAPLKGCRKHRCQFALLQNGHAIVSSATVSILSTIPILVDDKNLLFWKMGVLTSLTIVFSVLFSFTFFTLVLATMAPEGNGGKLWGRGTGEKWRPSTKSGSISRLASLWRGNKDRDNENSR